MTAAGSLYTGFWFAPEVISQCVWLYHRFPLSVRDVQELMLDRGVDVSEAASGRTLGPVGTCCRRPSTDR